MQLKNKKIKSRGSNEGRFSPDKDSTTVRDVTVFDSNNNSNTK